ncbi:hypothetical protein [Emticicia sp. C21]|uniref:hypothetical protein n=1 Tax=Emticicia sp. C21 TaxID=2302915 RepID=UPI000E3419AC|nr:hypothetical protein [Emticicia sp. C21]RFS13411.1 hypothetical protein D0T08_26680 [Emticicia sp. C21]
MENQKDTQSRNKNTSIQQGGNRNTPQQGHQRRESWEKAQLGKNQQAGNKNIHQQAQQNITGTGEEYQTTDLEAGEDDTSPIRDTKTHVNKDV